QAEYGRAARGVDGAADEPVVHQVAVHVLGGDAIEEAAVAVDDRVVHGRDHRRGVAGEGEALEADALRRPLRVGQLETGRVVVQGARDRGGGLRQVAAVAEQPSAAARSSAMTCWAASIESASDCTAAG